MSYLCLIYVLFIIKLIYGYIISNMFQYLSLESIYYKISRDMSIMNDKLKDWWVNLFLRQQQDQGYTVIDTDRGNYYLSYDELWNCD